MIINRHNLANHWKPACLWQRLKVSLHQKSWLLETQSLTAKFKKEHPDLRVEVLSENWQLPLNYERQALRLADKKKAWVRCVVLKSGQQRLLYARTVVEDLHSGNSWFAIKKLGTQPLGEILFNLKNVNRSAFKISKIDGKLARYSVFTQKKNKLLLTEVFLKSGSK